MNRAVLFGGVLGWSLLAPSLFAQQPNASPPPQPVSIEVVLYELDLTAKNDIAATDLTPARLLELEKQGPVSRLIRARLSTLDRTQAMVSLGDRAALATSRARLQVSNRGPATESPRYSTSYNIQNVGTIIEVKPTIQPDRTIQVVVNFETSQVDSLPPADDAAEDNIRPQGVTTMMAQTTVSVRSGEPTLVNLVQTAADKALAARYIGLTATADSPPKTVTAVETTPAAPAQAKAPETAPDPKTKSTDAPPPASERSVQPALRDAPPTRDARTPRDAPPAQPADPSPAPQITTQVIKLQRTQASQVARVLSQVYSAQEVGVFTDERTNSLVLRASQPILADAEKLIARIDDRAGVR